MTPPPMMTIRALSFTELTFEDLVTILSAAPLAHNQILVVLVKLIVHHRMEIAE